MGEAEIGRGAEGLDGLREHRVEIALVEHEIVHMALARIVDGARRQPLPAPVERDDGEAARQQFAHGLEILLDEFRPPLRQQHRAARLALRDASARRG